jgi:hypothetical protein
VAPWMREHERPHGAVVRFADTPRNPSQVRK